MAFTVSTYECNRSFWVWTWLYPFILTYKGVHCKHLEKVQYLYWIQILMHLDLTGEICYHGSADCQMLISSPDKDAHQLPFCLITWFHGLLERRNKKQYAFQSRCSSRNLLIWEPLFRSQTSRGFLCSETPSNSPNPVFSSNLLLRSPRRRSFSRSRSRWTPYFTGRISNP